MSTEDQIGLSNLAPQPGSRKTRKRVGKGDGSGSGRTCGRGEKGQKSRSGAKLPAGFEGGQMPLHRRLPKIGFASRKKLSGRNVFSLVSLDQLSSFEDEGNITLELLRSRGLIKSKYPKVKILGNGKLDKKLVVEAHAASASAKAAIEAAGGELKLV